MPAPATLDRLQSTAVSLEELSVWSIRDHVRAIEKAVLPPGKPTPDYRHLHDVARHATHVFETLDVARGGGSGSTSTTAATQGGGGGTEGRRRPGRGLAAAVQQLHDGHAEVQVRVQEIALAFNTVAQWDSGVSLSVARSAGNMYKGLQAWSIK
ncbi:hypothetical protein GGR56DRAFT_677624 [Xylariaceae sp. FL0804]|nr:hypothetical protein GGR56DRAFT_677624 [Xylariaceae sp. FL0804]